MAELKNILTTQLSLLSVSGLQILFSTLLLPVYIYALSPEEYGIVAILFVLIAFGTIICTGNLQMGFTTYYFDVEESKREDLLLSTLKLSFVLIIVFLVIGGIMTLKFNLFVDTSITVRLLLLTILIPPLKSILNIYNIFLIHQKSNKEYFNVNFSMHVINLFIQLVLLLILDFGILSIIIGLLVSTLIVLLYNVVPLFIKRHYKRTPTKHMLLYSLSLTPFLFSEWFIIRGDRLVVDRYFTLQEVGVYALTLNLAFLLSYITTSFLNSARPEFYTYIRNTKQSSRVIFSKYMGLLLLFLVFGSFCIYIITHILVLVTPHVRYSESLNYIIIAIMIIFIRSIIRYLNEIMLCLKDFTTTTLISFINSILFIFILMFFYPFSDIKSIMYSLLLCNTISLSIFISILYLKDRKQSSYDIQN